MIPFNASRRTFIISAVASSLSLGLGGWWLFKIRNDEPDLIVTNPDLVIATLRKHLGYLELDEAGLIAFAQELQTRERVKKEVLEEPELEEEWIVGKFLMSSDFFWHDADEAQIVNYVSYYDPYEGICANPFARFQ